MINIFPKSSGAALLLTVIILLVVALTVVLTSAGSQLVSQKVMINAYREAQAFEAAEAGLEFGTKYLKENNSSIVVDSDNDGYIDVFSNSDINNVSQANGTSYSITYSNPENNNLDLIQVSSVGQSSDGLVSRTVSQQVLKKSYLETAPAGGFVGKGDVSMSGNITITNTQTGTTIVSGGSVSFSGSASTDGGGGVSSDSGGLGSDVVENDSSVASMTNDGFFLNTLNMTREQVKANADIVYTASEDVNYSNILDGVAGKVIWLDHSGGGTARISSNTTIGSPDEPVILIVEGDFHVNGNGQIYGTVYVTNDWDNDGGGTLDIYGAAITEGNYSGQGTPNIIFDNTIFSNIKQNLVEYISIPGSWRDI